MIPSSIAPETPDSERRFYNRSQAMLPDSWTVIHGQRFLLSASRRHRTPPTEGEIDFLVLDPARGLLALEVKGGRVQRTREGWYSTDRHGERHFIKDPVNQVSDAIHRIGKYLNDDAPGFGRRGHRCQYGWGVVLPDIETRGDLGADLPRPVVVDGSDLADLRGAIDRVFGYRRLNGALSESAARALVSALRERFPPAATLAPQFKVEAEDLLRLTEEQVAVLDSLAAHNRLAIEGAAGTGKTVLAMEKARRLATTGAKVLLLCFNRPLAAHLRQQAEGFTVETFHDFCERMARRAALPFDAPVEHGPQHRPFWEEETPMLLLRALELLPEERYDAIVVDEGQDFLPDWWPCLDEALAQGREGTLYAFYDAHQSIFGGHRPPEALEISEYRLMHNCRNTARIAEYAARLMNLEPCVKVGAPQGEQVENIVCRNAEEMARKVAGRLTELVGVEGIDPARIAILSTRTLRNSPFTDDRRAGRFELVSLDAGRLSKNRMVFETLYRFKGLEADVVILLNLPGGSKAIESKDLYVAATRAKHLLIVARFA